MKIVFWGTNGSLPGSCTAKTVQQKVIKALEAANGRTFDNEQAIAEFVRNDLPFSVGATYGNNTACVQIGEDNDFTLLCDAGTGLRDYAYHLMSEGKIKEPRTYHIFISHLHWDHVQGFPFFAPAFIPGNTIIIHTYHKDTERVFREQMNAPTFPVNFDQLAANIIFDLQEPCTPYNIQGYTITSIEQDHPGTSYGYRFEKDGKIAVYSSDSEHKAAAYNEDYPFIEFYKNADLVIFDAQYSLTDATFTKADWGHSSNVIGVELAARAKVKNLAIFHHEPTSEDSDLDEFLLNTKMYSDIFHRESREDENQKQYPESILLSYDGLTLEL